MIQEKSTTVWTPNDRTIGKLRAFFYCVKINVLGPVLNNLSLMEQKIVSITSIGKDK